MNLSQMGITPDGPVPIWTLREVLDNSGLCLSKMHIHVRHLHFPTFQTAVAAAIRRGLITLQKDFAENIHLK